MAAGLLAAAAWATGVEVIALSPGRAELIVNGTVVRSLRPGQVSPEGVRLVSATASIAVLEIGGRRYELALGQATQSTAVLRADARGHFYTTVYINGQPMQGLLDTGASAVTLSAGMAQRLGIAHLRGQPVRMRTANGEITAHRVSLAWVQIGEVAVPDVDAVVMERDDSQMPALIGMSFLNRVDMTRSGDTLTLVGRRN